MFTINKRCAMGRQTTKKNEKIKFLHDYVFKIKDDSASSLSLRIHIPYHNLN